MILRFRKLKQISVHKIEKSLLFSSISFTDPQVKYNKCCTEIMIELIISNKQKYFEYLQC